MSTTTKRTNYFNVFASQRDYLSKYQSTNELWKYTVHFVTNRLKLDYLYIKYIKKIMKLQSLIDFPINEEQYFISNFIIAHRNK